MSGELTALASDPKVSALLGALGVMVLNEIVGRFFRRSERLETKWDEENEGTIKRLLDEVTGVRHAIELMGERFTSHQASASETKGRVDDHDGRISALEVGHVELRTRVEFLSSTTGGRDD